MRIYAVLTCCALTLRCLAIATDPVTSIFHLDTLSPLASEDDDLGSIYSDPSIETRLNTPTRSHISTEAKRKIASRQVTRSRLSEQRTRKRKRALMGLAPKASNALVQTCPASFYNLDVGGVAFHHGQAWLAPKIGLVKVYKTVRECYDYCASSSTCRAFTWYPRATGSDGHCYGLAGSDTSRGWVKIDNLSAQAGTYFPEGQCGTGQSCCLTTPWRAFSTCSNTGSRPSGSTGPVAHFQNWHSFNNQIFSRILTTRSDCEAYCRRTSRCFGFVWSPALNTCWLKTGDRGRYTQSGWAYNDAFSKGEGGGFYMLDATCGDITAGVPSGAMDSCCNE